MQGLSGKVVIDKAELLLKLKLNRKTHSTLVAEARAGYVNAAKHALERKLAKVREGKIVNLVFALSAPVDYTHVYDTTIQMLEMDMKPTVELTSTEFRALVMDKWDWTDHFITANSGYSVGTRRLSGEEDDDE